jgi:hypothetical protein
VDLTERLAQLAGKLIASAEAVLEPLPPAMMGGDPGAALDAIKGLTLVMAELRRGAVESEDLDAEIRRLSELVGEDPPTNGTEHTGNGRH